jgi:hypothetical protein
VLNRAVNKTFLEGYTFSLGYTLVSEEWPRVVNGPDSYSSRADSFSPGYTLFSVGGMAQGGDQSRLSNQGQLFLEGRLILSRLHFVQCRKNGPGWGIVQDSHSLGQTHSLQVTLCLVSEEWPRVRNGPKHFSSADSFSPGYTLFSVGGMAQGEKWSRLRNHK